jgi:SAM-dependent methyltransferase
VAGLLSPIKNVHEKLVLKRREDVIARSIINVLPKSATSMLDIGCGDGIISTYLLANRPGMQLEGAEVLERPNCRIKCTVFDGKTLPFADNSFDAVMMNDVLHHVDDIEAMLGEAMRVTRQYVVIKDHTWSNKLDVLVLKFMDWVGNRAYGVRLPYNYKQKTFWTRAFGSKGLQVESWNENLGLYPFPFSLVFERGKHFTALLSKKPVAVAAASPS